jgi:hypothetical protein
MATTITITLKSAQEVQEELKARLPELYRSSNIDIGGKPTPWVWLKTPKDVAKDETAKAVLKEIGFKWSRKRESWYHSCETDMTQRSFGRKPWRNRTAQPQQASAPATTKARSVAAPSKPRYQPTASTSLDDEFNRMFLK